MSSLSLHLSFNFVNLASTKARFKVNLFKDTLNLFDEIQIKVLY